MSATPTALPTSDPAAFVILTLAMLVFSCLMFNRYGSWRKNSLYVIAAVLLGWWLNSLIVFVIPIDVSSSIYLACVKAPQSDAGNCEALLQHPPVLSYLDPSPNGPLYWIWRVIYWTAYVSIWVVYPLLASFANSPEFKPSKRWWGAIKENLLYYGIYFAAALALLVYVGIASRGSPTLLQDLFGTAILIGNTFGLFLVICLLSIGLVRVPRELWRRSRRHVMLKHYWWHIADAHAELEAARRHWQTVLKVVHNADRNVPRHNHNRKYVDAVVASVPADEYAAVVVAEGDYECTYDGMVALHGRVQTAQWDHLRCRTVFAQYVAAAVHLEDVIDHARGHQVWWQSAVRWSVAPPRRPRCCGSQRVLDTLESWWYRYCEQVALKLLAAFCALLSVLIIWSETTFFTRSRFGVDLSVFSVLLGAARTPFAVELLVWLPVTYITVCVFSSLFAIRVLHYYRFLSGGVTNARTLLMSASYMGRLVPPLVYNYLMVIHCGPGLPRSPAYSQLMGTMNAVRVLGDAFTVFFPVVLLVLVIFVVTNVGARLLALCRVRQFEFDETFDDEHIANGERILRIEKQVLEREAETMAATTDDDEEAVAEPASAAATDVGVASSPSPAVERARLPRGQVGLLRSLVDDNDGGGGGAKKVGDDILDF